MKYIDLNSLKETLTLFKEKLNEFFIRKEEALNILNTESEITNKIKNTLNIVDVIDEYSSDTQVPSVKAVKNCLKEIDCLLDKILD